MQTERERSVAATRAAEPAAVAHHLRLFGLAASDTASSGDLASVGLPPSVATESAIKVRDRDGRHRATVVLQPQAMTLAAFDVTARSSSAIEPIVQFAANGERPWNRARTLHPIELYECHREHDVAASDATGAACWIWLTNGGHHVLLAGTALGADLIRYRQGDPSLAANRPSDVRWGIPGERPNYLFEGQILRGQEQDRPADWWAMGLAATIAARLNDTLPAMLPGAAPGAVVITGDDDQAYLEKYQEQQARLDGLPSRIFFTRKHAIPPRRSPRC